MNKSVKFELAKLLKDNGFDEPCHKIYIAQCLWQKPNSREKYKNSDIHKNSNDVTSPTIAEVVCWIYTKYDIWISLIPCSSSGHRLLDRNFSVSLFRYNMNINVQAEILRKDRNILYFNLPENAFEYAITHILNTYKPTS